MADDDGKLFLLSKVPSRLKAPVAAQTVVNWAKFGVKGVKLAVTRIGGRDYTSQANLDGFLERLRWVKDNPPAAAPKNPPTAQLADYLQTTHVSPGDVIPVAALHENFLASLEPEDRVHWPRKRLSLEMPARFPKGRRRGDGVWCFGNLSFDPPRELSTAVPLVLVGETLQPSTR